MPLPSLSMILGILLAVSVAGNMLLGHLYVASEKDGAATSQAYKDFVGGTKIAGDKQNAKAAEDKKADDKLKKETDENHKKEVGDLKSQYAAANAELQRIKSGASGSGLSPFALSTGKLKKATCNPADIVGAVSNYRQEVYDAYTDYRQEILGVLEQGDTAIVDVNSDRAWAKDLKP